MRILGILLIACSAFMFSCARSYTRVQTIAACRECEAGLMRGVVVIDRSGRVIDVRCENSSELYREWLAERK